MYRKGLTSIFLSSIIFSYAAKAEPVYFCEVTHIAVLENDKPPIISHNSGERIKFSFNNDRVKFSQDSW